MNGLLPKTMKKIILISLTAFILSGCESQTATEVKKDDKAKTEEAKKDEKKATEPEKKATEPDEKKAK